ncbi:MAG: SLC13 family permease, partial [Gemmatimonadaceae bacterium]
LRRRFHVNIVGIRRPHRRSGRLHRLSRTAEESLQAGDEIDVHAAGDDVARLCAEQRLELVGDRSEADAVLAEVLLTPRSRLIGQTLESVRFRSRYGANVLSIRRQGAPVEVDLATVPLRFADTLLVAGSPKRIDLLRSETGDFVVVSRTRVASGAGRLSRREILALAIMLGMLVLLTLELVPAATAVLLAAVCMVLAGCLDMNAAYREINWQSVILIAAILPMATALQKTGGTELIVALLQPIGEAGPLAVMVALFVLTGAMGQFISNTATAALVAPIAMSSAVQMGISPYPLLMAVAIASSTSFATPVATPVNMLVLGPGNYRFGDFARVGLPLQLVCGVLTALVVPLLFPF